MDISFDYGQNSFGNNSPCGVPYAYRADTRIFVQGMSLQAIKGAISFGLTYIVHNLLATMAS